MNIGLNLPVMAPGLDRALLYAWCRGIDEGPFSSLAVGERINFPNPEMTVAISAAAAWTTRVPLFYNVMVLPMHPEARAAKQIATLDVLSNGRVVLGVGVGGREDDYAAVGAPWPGRLARLERQVGELRRLWAGGLAPGARDPIEPKPVQPGGPRILVGALFPRAITRAAHFADGILGFSFTLAREELEYAFGGARAAWTAAGRTEPPRLVTGCWFALGPAGRRQMDEYLGRYLRFLGPSAASLIPLVPTVDASGLRDAVTRARDAGADEIILAPTTLDPDEIKRVEDLLF
ncbi:MAG: LLM class flavin-dependent oxidoreductase [Deltaproteobacteria bacterium]|nr:LLM class flavin-dependent oxidoreductase [Deltaproteobacteria bacterium]